MSHKMKIGILAPSSKTPPVELQLGLEKLHAEGLSAELHPQCHQGHLFFAGTDPERAQAFFDWAQRPDLSVLWCARGGYGALRLLPLLDAMTRKRGVPRQKLLVGYSDATILMEYVRKKWKWATLHAPMPSMRQFSLLPQADWDAMKAWTQGSVPLKAPWSGTRLEFWSKPPRTPLMGNLVGGNLTVLTGLVGTPYASRFQGKWLFLEDIDESLYRIDRMIQQLLLSGSLKGVKAILLGNFLNCEDHPPQGLIANKKNKQILSQPQSEAFFKLLSHPPSVELTPVRKKLSQKEGLKAIFGELGDRLGIPIAFGLPVGHGPQVSPLPLGAEYELSPKGLLKLKKWSWYLTGDSRKKLG